MAIAGLLIGILAGMISAGVGFFVLGLSFWICLALYAFVGALCTLGTVAYALRASRRDWGAQRETALG